MVDTTMLQREGQHEDDECHLFHVRDISLDEVLWVQNCWHEPLMQGGRLLGGVMTRCTCYALRKYDSQLGLCCGQVKGSGVTSR